MKAIKAIIKVAREFKRSPKPGSCKNIPKPRIPSNQRGTKIVTRPTNGCLYIGRTK